MLVVIAAGSVRTLHDRYFHVYIHPRSLVKSHVLFMFYEGIMWFFLLSISLRKSPPGKCNAGNRNKPPHLNN